MRDVVLPSWMTKDVDAHLSERVGTFPESLLFVPKGNSEFIHDSDFNKSWNPAREAAGVQGCRDKYANMTFGGSAART